MNVRICKLYASLLLILTVAACGGGDSDSGFGESLAQEREALDCISFSNGVFTNSCDFTVIVRAFIGAETPIQIAANSSAPLTDPAAIGLISYGACKAPYTPVKKDGGFECL